MTFAIAPGTTTFSGFSVEGSPAPLITVTLRVNEQWLTQMQNAQRAEPQAVSLRLVQTSALARPVSTFTLNALYAACATPGSVGDKVVLTGNVLAGNTPGREAVALIGGKRDDCVTREPHLGLNVIGFENLLSPVGCGPAQVSIFSYMKRMEFRPNTDSTWDDDEGNILPVTLADPVQEKVKIWLLYDNCASDPLCVQRSAIAGSVSKVARASLNLAKDRYPALFAGITFVADPDEPVNLMASTAQAVSDARVLYCSDLAKTQATVNKFNNVRALDSGPQAARLHLVFVQATDGWGTWCGEHAVENDSSAQGADIILLSSFTRDLTLAHEIGHALLNTGDHALDDNSGFAVFRGNLMYGADFGRYLSIGQMFRMNLGQGSAVNRHGARPAGSPIVECPVFEEDGATCPSACFDVNRNVDLDPEIAQCAP